MTSKTKSGFLPLKDAAADLDMTAARLRNLIHDYRIPGYKFGHRWYLTAEDVVRVAREGVPEPVPQRYDRTYRHLFSHPEVIRDFLEGFVAKSWVEELDLSTLKKVSEAFVSDRLSARWADMVWEVKWRAEDMHACLMFEFQNTVEPYMPARWLSILGAFYQDQVRQLGEKGKVPELMLPPSGGEQGFRLPRLPLVFLFVIYNGKPAWWSPQELIEEIACPPGKEGLMPVSLRFELLDMGRVPKGQLRDLGESLTAALVRLETSDSRQALWQEVDKLREWLPERFHTSFELWLRATLVDEGLELSEKSKILRRTGSMLSESLREWRLEAVEEGLTKGQAKVVLRQAGRKFGRLDDQTRRRIETADEETLLRYADRILTARKVSDLF